MKNAKYDFSSTHVDLPNPLASDIQNWGMKKIRDSDIFVGEEDRRLGREDEIHVTILYGIHSDKPDEVIKCIEGTGPIKGTLDKVSIFSKSQFDVIVIDVISNDFRKLNDKLRKDIPFTNQYSEYKPHVTIAYVKKNRGWQYSGERIWKGKSFICESIVFSSTNGVKTKIRLD